MKSKKYSCAKCGKKEFDTGEIRAAGGFLTKIFDIQNRKLVTVTCSACGYTELYADTKKRTGENILDFLTS